MKQPTAWIPLGMSALVLAAAIVCTAFNSIHAIRIDIVYAVGAIFQILMVAQIPIAGLFAFRWITRTPGQALFVLAIQAGTWLMVMIILFFSPLWGLGPAL